MLEYNALAQRYTEEIKLNADMQTHNAALICASIYEQNRDRKKRAKPFTPADFLPKEGQEPGKKRKQTAVEMLAVFQTMGGIKRGA